MTNSSNLPTRGNCNVSSCGTFENGNAESNTPLIPLYIIVRSALKFTLLASVLDTLEILIFKVSPKKQECKQYKVHHVVSS